MRTKVWHIFCIVLGLGNHIIVSSSESELKKRNALQPVDPERTICDPLDTHRAVIAPSNNPQNLQKSIRPRSPSLSSGESNKRRSLEGNDVSGKENSPGSGSDSSSTKGYSLLLSDAKSRKKLYNALQKNEHEVAWAVLMIMALNKLDDPDKIRTSYQTLQELFPRFNKTIKENFPGHSGYCYVDILCSFAPWHSALMVTFFDELRKDILRPTPQVLRARYYAVKWLEVVLKRLLQEVLDIIAVESPSLLTPSVSAFLNPEFVEQSFEGFLYQELSKKINESKGYASTGSDIYEQNTPPVSIFEGLAALERQGASAIREAVIHDT